MDNLVKAKALLVSARRLYGPSGDSVDRSNEEAEFNAFIRIGLKLFDIPPETLGRVSEADLVAAMLAEDREHGATAPRKRGRPPTLHKHCRSRTRSRPISARG
jgi:hypothetical protein